MSSSAPFSRGVLPLAIMAALLPTSVFAAQNTDALNTLTIYSDTYRNTASKSALEPEETPQGITIIDRASLDQRAVDSINEALRYVPAVNTELRGGAVSRMDQFNIRGFSNYSNFYDGLPLQYNEWNLQPQIDAAAVEQIEIFKGPTSVLYGQMPPGGMVNIIAKQPSDETKNTVEVTIGNRNLRNLTVNSQGILADNETLSYTLTAKTSQRDGQAVTSQEKRHLIAAALDWQISDATLINVNFYHQQDPESGIYNTLPAEGVLFDNPNGMFSVNSFSGDANWNEYDREVTLAGYKISHKINENWTFLQNARLLRAEVAQKNIYSYDNTFTGISPLSANKRDLDRRAYSTDESSQGFVIDNQLSATLNTSNVEHNLLFGIDFAQLDSQIIYDDVQAPKLDLFAPDYFQIDSNMDISNSAWGSDYELSSTQTGVYFQDQMLIDRLILVAGGRYDYYKGREVRKTVSDVTIKQEQFSSRFGAMYNFDSGLSPFISYAQSFEPINGSDRHGNKFKQATADQIEIGIKYNPVETDTALTLSAFRIVKENSLTRDPTGTAYDKIQVGEVTSQGLELALHHSVTESISVDFNAALIDMEFSKDPLLQGKTPVWVPEKMASIWLNYQLTSSAVASSQLGLGIRYVGETQLNTSNTNTVPGYTLVDLSYTTGLGGFNNNLESASLNLSVNNLFNKRYASCYDENNCWFGAERSIEAKFKYEF